MAKHLTKFRVNNAVRFAFWSAEEFGLLGSYFYIKSINGSETELAKVRAYLNFDMIASPNYVYAVYDGDGNACTSSLSCLYPLSAVSRAIGSTLLLNYSRHNPNLENNR